ncbi:MAG: MAPEG family protein [Polyangiaceae bacterium]|nr:MAPEG family protein [Polyangiaceae bacterium]
MKTTAIFMPTFALMLWTALVLVQVPIRRFTAYCRRRASFEDFRYGDSPHVPPDVALPNRVFMNLLEVPVLFYVLTLIAFVTGNVNPVVVGLCWGYVFLRVVHSLVYFTYNHPVHRFAVFVASNLVVLTLIFYLGQAFLWA